MTPLKAATKASNLIRQGCTDLAQYDRLIAKFPKIDYLKAAKSEAAFKGGDVKTGLSLCRYRWALHGMKRADVTCKEWDGKESCDLIVICEQGLGEQILFSAMFGKIKPATIATDDRLIPLFAMSFPNHQFVPLADVRQYETKHSRHIYTMDLARTHLGDGNPQSWLMADTSSRHAYKDALQDRFGMTTNIGLSWRSYNSQWGGDKSINTDNLLPLVRDERITAISLQYGYNNADAVFWSINGGDLHQMGGLDTTNNLDGVATLIDSLDAVVTCSNTVAHLAGALGKPTLLIIPTAFNLWYWGAGERTPWYPSVRIIRSPDYSTMADTVITLRDQTST